MLRSMCKKQSELAGMENLLKLFGVKGKGVNSSKIVKEYATNSLTAGVNSSLLVSWASLKKDFAVAGSECDICKPKCKCELCISDIAIGNN